MRAAAGHRQRFGAAAGQPRASRVDCLATGSAAAVPTAQEGLQEQHRLRERQAGRRTSRQSRLRVSKAWAQVTSAQW